MLTEKMENALNNQLNAELYSGYLYLSMNAYFKSINLDGFANWMYFQAQEELTHAMKLYDFIISRGGRVKLAQVEAPPTLWDSPLAVFEATLKHMIMPPIYFCSGLYPSRLRKKKMWAGSWNN